MVTASSVKHPRLDATQVKAFREEGFVILHEPVFPEAEFAALREHFEKKLANLAPDQRPEGMDVPHFADPALFRWLLADCVLDLVEPLIGPDIALFSSHFICKPGGHGKRVAWHEDSNYWKTMLSPMEVVTVWLAIDQATVANGCMHVIPRTHNTGRKGYSDYRQIDPATNVFQTEILPEQRREELAVACELNPNEASLHDGRLMHGSPANSSPQRRCGYTMRYVPTHVKMSDSHKGRHQFYLARGRDKAGNCYGDPTKAYPELARYRELKGVKGH